LYVFKDGKNMFLQIKYIL